MKQRFTKFISVPTFFILFIISCGDSNQEIKLIEKVTDFGITLSEENVKSAGFKINKNYDTEELPNAIKAFYGWKSVGEEGRKDFEIRIYSTHQDVYKYLLRKKLK